MRRTRRRPLPRHAVTPRAALVFGLALGVVVDAAGSGCGQLAVGRAGAGRERVLRRRLHDAAQAAHRAEHRLGRRRRVLPGADRLDRGHRRARLGARSCCSRWCSSGRRRTSGRWRSATATTTRPPRCRCCRWSRRRVTVGRQIVAYTWATVATSLLLWPVGRHRVVLPRRRRRARGWRSWSRRTGCWRGPAAATTRPRCAPMRLFHGSNLYLALLFLAVALDPLLR